MAAAFAINSFMEGATRTQLIARAAPSQSQVSQNGGCSSGTGLSSLLTALVPVFLYAVAFFVAFLILRLIFPRNYVPRTFLGSLRPEQRTPALPQGRFNWFKSFFQMPDTYVLNHHSLDSFLFLRLLKVMIVTLIVGMCICFPILFPVNATGGGCQKELDKLNMANIENSIPNNTFRYFAHAVCAWLFYGFVMFMITRESIYYINLRQAYLLSPLYSSRLSSRTVLFTSVPDEYTDETNLRRMLGDSVVRRVWIASNTKELDDLVKQRDKAAYKLEGAETKLIRTANGKRLKAEKKSGKGKDTNGTNGSTSATDVEHGSSAAQWLSPKDRPTHKLKLLGLCGQKVDSIDWCRSELQHLIPEVDKLQAKHQAHDAAKLNSVFVEFTTLAEAQAAYQSLTHHQILHMSPRYTGMTPGEVIWSNLRIKWWERVIRLFATTAFVTVLVIFWSVPVAFIGAISNVSQLAQTPGLEWLSFLSNLPSFLLGLVNGLLPSILLAVLMALLPIILRLMAKLSGDPTLSAVELSTQNYYFAFQVVDVFLVTTLGSAASAAVGQIAQNPSLITSLLSSSIPTASDFYLSYFVLQGLAVVGNTLLQLTGVVVFILLGKILDSTPRKQYKRWISLSGVGWGTLFPIYETLFVIALCYAIIAPFVMLFATIGLYLFYLAYRYNFLYVSNNNIDTKGRVYPLALQHLFVGLYISEVCIIGLFAIATGSGVGAIGPLIMMIILLVFTVLYHMSLNSALKPLIDYLPKSLESEERQLLLDEKAMEEKGGASHSDDLGPAPHQKPSFITKFLKPHIYNDYHTMRRLVPRNIDVRYEPEVEANAYYAPSINSGTPLLWIPRDPMGLSKQEIKETSKVIPITDEDAKLDEKNKVTWHAENGRPPIWQEDVYY